MLKKVIGASLLILAAPLVILSVDSRAQEPIPLDENGNPPDHYWPESGKYPVSDAPYSKTLRSVALEHLAEREKRLLMSCPIRVYWDQNTHWYSQWSNSTAKSYRNRMIRSPIERRLISAFSSSRAVFKVKR